jgi:hypothetical protein
MNLTAAPAIQAPSPTALAELARRIEADAQEGPCFMWDPAAEVFLTAIVRQGVIVHWQLDPARTKAEADAVRDRQMQAAMMAAMAIVGALPEQLRDEMRANLERGLGRHRTH